MIKPLFPFVGFVLGRHSVKRRPEDDLPIVSSLLNTLQNVIPRLVQTLLIGNLIHNPLGCPASCSLLDRTHVKNSVMQMSHDPLVGFTSQKRPIAMHAVTRKKTTFALRDEACYVLIQSVCGLLRSSCGFENSSGEARV